MLAAWGPIDILVNNAGVAFYGPTEKMTAAQWDWLLGINLLAPIQITRELLPDALVASRGPHRQRVQRRGPGGRRPHDGLSREQVRPRRLHGIARVPNTADAASA